MKDRSQGPFASFVRAFAHALHGTMPICVCKTCVRETDEVVGESGDFSLCDRCHASITSKDGAAVREGTNLLRDYEGGTK